jgi:hypothetical protein
MLTDVYVSNRIRGELHGIKDLPHFKPLSMSPNRRKNDSGGIKKAFFPFSNKG